MDVREHLYGAKLQRTVAPNVDQDLGTWWVLVRMPVCLKRVCCHSRRHQNGRSAGRFPQSSLIRWIILQNFVWSVPKRQTGSDPSSIWEREVVFRVRLSNSARRHQMESSRMRHIKYG